MKGRQTAYLVLLLFAVTFALFGNTFRNGWTYDDIPVVVENADTHSLEGFLRNTSPGRPLRELSYMVDYRLFGERPAGYHVQQLLWHGANGALIYLLLLELGATGLPALAGALLFLAHPLQVESVASVGHRKELLALFFALLSTFLYIRALAASGTARIGRLALSVAAFGLAVLGNETAAVLPLALAVYERLLAPGNRRMLLTRPWLLPAAISVAVVAVVVSHPWLFSAERLQQFYAKNGLPPTSEYWPLLNGALRVYLFYLGKLVWPLDLGLEYAIPLSRELIQPLALVGGCALLASLTLVFLLGRRAPVAAFGLGWFLVFYLPVSSFLPISYLAADRYMYLPLAGLALLVAGLLPRNPGKVATGLFCLLLLLLSSVTVRQNGVWFDEHTLWRHAAQVSPDSSYANESAAYSYLLNGDLEKARPLAEAAVRLNPLNAKAFLVLAQIEEGRGDLQAALQNYELFVKSGVRSHPALVEQVAPRLPELRLRVRQLDQLRKG